MSRDEGLPSPEAGRDRLTPWRAAALGVVTLAGVVAASLVALVAMMTLERWLVPNGDAAEAGHGVALGAFVVVWGLFSLGVLAGAARVTLGPGATLARGDLAAAGLVLLLQGDRCTRRMARRRIQASLPEPRRPGRSRPAWVGMGASLW